MEKTLRRYRKTKVMVEHEEQKAEGSEDSEPVQLPRWLNATMDDVRDFDFEAPIAGLATADCQEISDRFRGAADGNGGPEPVDTSAKRSFRLLCSVAGMYFKPDDRSEPFGPMLTLANGGRSAIPSDFRKHVDCLANMAGRAINSGLKSRLADLCWLLDRKRADLGLGAVAAYVDIVRNANVGAIPYRFATMDDFLTHDARDYLRRALIIGRAIDWDHPETVAAREMVQSMVSNAFQKVALTPIHWFCELDLDFGLSNPQDIAVNLDRLLATPLTGDFHTIVDLWRLTARAYHIAKQNNDRDRCSAEAAERMVAEAQRMSHSAFLASHLISNAIAQLHGVSGQRGRRTELRHLLVDAQSRIGEEMTSFSHEMDLRAISESVQAIMVKQTSLFDKLFAFAALSSSPDPDDLAREALKAMQEHPLMSIIGTSHLDRDGKVIHRSEGGHAGENRASATYAQIAQRERIRRTLVAHGNIEVARITIVENYFLSDDVLGLLLSYSPFVPPDLLRTFSRGFTYFFRGDFVGALYVLTPLLENSLRHLLRVNGHDVSVFNDSMQTQEDRGITALFGQMRDELDAIFTKPITTDIDNAFLRKPGPYLRHAVAHGLLRDGDPQSADAIYGCWLIFQLCLMPLFRHREELGLR